MTELEKARRVVFSVARQLASVEVRRKALATLRPGDVVQAMDPETLEPRWTRRLDGVDALDWPSRYVAGSERFDADGVEIDAWMGPVDGGLVLVRPWLSPAEAEHLVWESSRPVARPPFSWHLYEQHMAATHSAVMGGYALPEAPWHED